MLIYLHVSTEVNNSRGLFVVLNQRWTVHDIVDAILETGNCTQAYRNGSLSGKAAWGSFTEHNLIWGCPCAFQTN